MLLNSIPTSMAAKLQTVKLLESECRDWFGVGVLTFLKQNKQRVLVQKIFTDDLQSISQYVRPLGFVQGELVLPSNAICYTSFNKGNNQVTFILTDVLKYADVVKYFSTMPAKKRRQRAFKLQVDDMSSAGVSSSKGQARRVKRFSYGMTVLKEYSKPREVQFCLLALLSMAFHLLRKWCRMNTPFASLLDATYVEPSFEDLTLCLVKKSEKMMDTPFTEVEIHLLLKRAHCLFKKLVELFLKLYPASMKEAEVNN